MDTDHTRGLYGKYHVERIDGSSLPGGKHEHCQYFVLDLTHDTHAMSALEAYALSCQDEYPLLAQDLMALVRSNKRGRLTRGPLDAYLEDAMPEDRKPILVLDFDGVLHSYTSGWQGADVANDDPVPGAIEFCNRAIEKFTLWVVSSRCGQDGGTTAILRWLEKWHFPMGMYVSDNGSKPAAFLTLDDRAMTFDGHWPDIDLMLRFKPWYKRGVRG